MAKSDLESMDPLGSLPDAAAVRAFSETIARHFGRPAFPDDFVASVQKFRDHVVSKHGRASPEGSALMALHEIRVVPRPSWKSDEVAVTLFFIVPDRDLVGIDGKTPLDDAEWEKWVATWGRLMDATGTIKQIEAVPVTYRELDALTYRSSEPLDIDYLSGS